MSVLDAPRPALAAAEREPRTIDRPSSAIRITSTTPPDAVATVCDDRTAYLLAELRCAALRARLAACEIDAIGIALRSGMIDPGTAIAWLHDSDVLHYVTLSQGGST
jgi:hypothetical protein